MSYSSMNNSGYGNNMNNSNYGNNMNNSNYGNNVNNSNTYGQNTAGMQGQRTGGAGKGPDMICKILDKLEHKFGGRRFNDPANDAKNRALNQKIARRIMTIAPKVLKKLPMMLKRM